jgi:rSAM/selenodomain-associated transferase 2
MRPEISIIIPALNEAASLGATLSRLRGFENAEVIVADGGSEDGTKQIALDFGAIVIDSKRGRGPQLIAGTNAATADVLWFLHADTLAPPDAVEKIKAALADDRNAGGNFSIRFDGNGFWSRFLTFLYPKLRLLGLIYGDSGIFARRAAYEKIGGFRDYPIFEDLEFVRRLRKTGKIRTVDAVVETSSRRFEKKSFTLVFLRWTILQVLFWLRVSPERLVKIYFK